MLGARPGAVVVHPKARRPLRPFSAAPATSRAMSDTGSPTSYRRTQVFPQAKLRSRIISVTCRPAAPSKKTLSTMESTSHEVPLYRARSGPWGAFVSSAWLSQRCRGRAPSNLLGSGYAQMVYGLASRPRR